MGRMIKILTVLVLAIACVALQLIYPGWRSEARAQGYVPLVKIGELVHGFGRCTPFNSGPRIPMWGQFGSKQILEANSGEKLEVECALFPDFPRFPPVFSYVMFYTSPEGTKSRVGICPFMNGCNEVKFFHSGDSVKDDGTTGADGKPDRIVSTSWVSKDYGFNDTFPNPWTGQFEPSEFNLDWAESVYDVGADNLSKVSYKYIYNRSPSFTRCPDIPPPEGDLVQTTTIDPPLGPETEAFFDQVIERLAQLPVDDEELVMLEDTSPPCDLDRDGDCDAGDQEFFEGVFGACRGDSHFHPRADADGSGCVDEVDQRFFFRSG